MLYVLCVCAHAGMCVRVYERKREEICVWGERERDGYVGSEKTKAGERDSESLSVQMKLFSFDSKHYRITADTRHICDATDVAF